MKTKMDIYDFLVRELKGVETKDRIYQMSGWFLLNVSYLSFAFVALRSLFERHVHTNLTEKEIEKNSYMASVLTVWDNNHINWIILKNVIFNHALPSACLRCYFFALYSTC